MKRYSDGWSIAALIFKSASASVGSAIKSIAFS